MTYDLAPVLEHYAVDFDPDRYTNQKIKCPNPEHDDARASASVLLEEGLINCFGCGLTGTAVALIICIEGLEFREARRRAEELAGTDRSEVSRGGGRENGFLPGRSGSRPGRRAWKSPWTGRHP